LFLGWFNILRQVYVFKDGNEIFSRSYGKALSPELFDSLLNQINKVAFKGDRDKTDFFDYYNSRVIYATSNEMNILFFFISSMSLTFENLKDQMSLLKTEFLNLFSDVLKGEFDASMFDLFEPTLDKIHRNLKPKISLVGFSGVGKTTITRLIKAEEIPTEHIPTITGDISTIKIGKLQFNLWDFAGQEEFSFLWNKFIHGSDAVLLISDSSIENVEKSKFFAELIKEEAPRAHAAVIANKQDIPGVLPPDEIEKSLGMKAYKMIAIDPENREKMITIIADILEISADVSPLLQPLFERDRLLEETERVLAQGDFMLALKHYDRILLRDQFL